MRTAPEEDEGHVQSGVNFVYKKIIRIVRQ